MTWLLYATIALLVWPPILYQIIAFYLGFEKAINQMKADQSDFKQDNQLWLNAEPIISVLVALAYEKIARSV